MAKKIKTSWLFSINENQLKVILIEYNYFVKRFTQWLSLTIGFCENETIRQLLMPNLIDEQGEYNSENISHLKMLENSITSCNFELDDSIVSQETRDIESYFYNVFKSGNTYKSLCLLGPATEDISHDFLVPLEDAIKRIHHDKNVDFQYFDEHRRELEDEHSEYLRLAIEIYENEYFDGNIAEFEPLKKDYIREGLSKHQKLWDNLKQITIGEESTAKSV